LNAKVSRYSIHPKLSWSVFYRRFLVARQIALQLFSFPCTAAGGERNFKTRSRIHSKVRNRLVFDSVDMQLYVSYNCAQLKRNVLLEGKRNAKSFEEILIGHKIDEDLEEITWPEETEYLIVEDNQFTENCNFIFLINFLNEIFKFCDKFHEIFMKFQMKLSNENYLSILYKICTFKFSYLT